MNYNIVKLAIKKKRQEVYLNYSIDYLQIPLHMHVLKFIKSRANQLTKQICHHWLRVEWESKISGIMILILKRMLWHSNLHKLREHQGIIKMILKLPLLVKMITRHQFHRIIICGLAILFQMTCSSNNHVINQSKFLKTKGTK